MAASEKRPEIIALARELKDVPMCEEYERMVSGMMYNPNTPKLLEARHRCRGLAADYNGLDTKTVPYEQIAEKRLELLRRVVGRVGDGTFIEPPFMADYGCNVIIGKDCFVNWKYVVPCNSYRLDTLNLTDESVSLCWTPASSSLVTGSR